MATQDVIKTLTIRSKTEGVQESAAALKGLAAAHDGVAKSAASSATVTDTSAKSQLSLADAVARAERRFNSALRAQQDFEKLQRQMNAAVAQNPALQERANAVLALAAQHFGNVSKTQQAASVVAQDFASRLSSVTGAAGSVGSVLSALGPIGIGLAATFGGVVLALNAMSTAAHDLAEKAQELRRFSEITGLTTSQVQALRSEASKFGVTSDEAQTAIQNFTARFNDLRLGQGELLTQIRRVNPALAEQMQMTTNAGDALTLFGQALAKVDDVFQRNALVKAATGRGGLTAAAFLANLNVDALTKSYVDAGKGLDDNLIKKLAQLEIDIKKTSATAQQNIASIFAESVLQAQLSFVTKFLEFSKAAKEFAASEDLKKLINNAQFMAQLIASGPKALFNAGARFVDPNFGLRTNGPADLNDPLRTAPAPLNLRSSGPADLNDPTRVETAKSLNLTLEAQVEKLKKLNEILGPAATESEKLALKQKELELAFRDSGLSAGVLARAQAALNAEFRLNALSEMVATLGAAATPAEQLKLKFAELEQKLATGKITLDTFNRSIADFQREQDVSALRTTVSALGSAATAAERYKLTLAELQQQLDRGQISQDTFNRAALAANPIMQEMTKGAEQFADTLVQGLIDGKNFVDTLEQAFKNLAKTMASAAIKDLMSGNFEKAAVEAAVAAAAFVASKLLNRDDDKALEAAKLKFAQMTDEVNNFIRAADGFDLSPFVTAIQQIKNTALELIKAAVDAHDFAKAIQLIISATRQVNNQVDQFIKPRGNSVQDQIDAENAQARQLIDELNDLNAQYHLGLDRTNDILAGAAAHIAEIQRKAEEEINKRRLTFQDRVFAAANDNTTLEGQLAAQARQFARERLEEQDANGQAMTDLLAAQQAEELALRKSFADKATEVTKQAEQQRLDAINGTAKSVVDYLNGLTSGPSSTLSPTAILANAQATYNANLALAQGGNIDAQNKFVSLADNLEKAARAVYASGQGYQDIRNQIINQGLALPAVQQTTDPVVQAIRDSITAIQATKAAIDGTTGAIELMRVALTTAVESGSAANIASALSVYFNALDTTTNGLLDFSEFVTGLGQANLVTTPDLSASDAQTRDRLQLIFNELDVNGDGQLSRLELIKASTAGTDSNTNAAVNRLDTSIANLNTLINQFQQDVNFSASINTAATRIVQAINNLGAGPIVAIGNNMSNQLAAIRSDTFQMATHQAGSGATNGQYAGGLVGNQEFHFTPAEFGATIPPRGLGIFAEHHPQGPIFMRAGDQPIPITPSLPPSFRGGANDNGEMRAILSELQSIRRDNGDQRFKLAQAIHMLAQATGKGHAEIIEALDEQTESMKTDARQDRNNPQKQKAA